MSFQNPDSLYKTLKGMSLDEISKSPQMDIWIVTTVNFLNYTASIQHPNFKQIQYSNVPIMGIGMGNYKGVFKYPDPGDFAIVLFLGKGQQVNPIIIGTMQDILSQNPDVVPQILQKELLIRNDTLGSIIFINKDNNIVLKTADLTGNLNNGAKVTLTNEGDILIQAKTGLNKSIGSGTITAFATNVIIANTRITANSKVFTEGTDINSTGGRWVDNIIPNTSFRVNIGSSQITNNNFQYLIVDG